MSRKSAVNDEQDWWYPELPEGFFWRMDRSPGRDDRWCRIQIRRKLTGFRKLFGLRNSERVGAVKNVPMEMLDVGYAMIVLKNNRMMSKLMNQPFSLDQANKNVKMEFYILQENQEISKVEQWVNQR